MSDSKYLLFHQIGPDGGDSAEVRQFIVRSRLKDKIEFMNVGYEDASDELRRLAKDAEVPCLVADGIVYSGKAAILSFLGRLI